MTRQFNIGFKSNVAMIKIQQTKKGGSLDRKPEMAVQAKIRAQKKQKTKKGGEEEEEGKGLLDRKPKVFVWIEIKEIKKRKGRWRQIIQTASK